MADIQVETVKLGGVIAVGAPGSDAGTDSADENGSVFEPVYGNGRHEETDKRSRRCCRGRSSCRGTGEAQSQSQSQNPKPASTSLSEVSTQH